MSTLTFVEEQVMRKLLAGEDDALAVLRQQLEMAVVSSRKLTGVGFYTSFSIPSEAPRLPGHPSFKLGDVNGTAANLQYGAGFLLYVNDGAIAMLEGYTYDEAWPDNVDGLELTYSGGRSREMKKLKEIIHGL